ncbi:ADP-ribosylation factor-like protein 11 [Lampris incognitus]|uniref:ADP-ribosylation factor-like protein 11 n=1 Tax=Lampris incognitus TaxID=2546036 RepID=UPI0024B49C5D|nr:ADP-ribosylation factor-like protein 11 [Lampris incognitus]
MGQGLSRNSSNPPPQVILVGLDSSGKSTLLARLLTGQVMDTSPTVGFNVGTLELNKNTALTVWDVGGQKSMRPNWRYYLEGCRALVFMVDSSDAVRMPEAQKALKKILSDENLKGIPLMVLANKKDLPNSMTIRESADQTWSRQNSTRTNLHEEPHPASGLLVHTER